MALFCCHHSRTIVYINCSASSLGLGVNLYGRNWADVSLCYCYKGLTHLLSGVFNDYTRIL